MDDRYGHPVFKMTVPICSVCKNFNHDDLICKLNVDVNNDYKYGRKFNCDKAIIDENSNKIKYWKKQQAKKK